MTLSTPGIKKYILLFPLSSGVGRFFEGGGAGGQKLSDREEKIARSAKFFLACPPDFGLPPTFVIRRGRGGRNSNAGTFSWVRR